MVQDLHSIKLVRDAPSPWVRPKRPWIEIGSLDYPELPLYALADQAAGKIKNNLFATLLPANEKYSFYELKYFSDRLASALSRKFGVGKGKSVALMTWNRPEFLMAAFGIQKTGASCAPINPLLTREDVEYIVENAGIIDTIFVHEAAYQKVDGVKGLENYIIIGKERSPGAKTLWELVDTTFWELIEEFRHVREPPKAEINPREDLALLMYTGGTTGRPKGVMLTHFNLLSNALQVSYAQSGIEGGFSELLENPGKRVGMAVLPMAHIYGFTMSMVSLHQGQHQIMFERFDERAVLEAIERYGVEYFHAAPTMWVRLANYPEFGKYDLGSLKYLGSGAAALAPEVSKRLEKKGKLSLGGQGYGLTECSCVTAIGGGGMAGEERLASIGWPIVDTDVKFVDPETGEEVPPGEVGEVWWKGPQVMKGYWKAPEETAKVLKEGWVNSGDLGRMDDWGYIYIVGRTKDMIKYKGYRLLPDDIEYKLFEHPAIKECAVVGVPDPEVGENIKAFVVLKGDFEGKVAEGEIVRWAKERVGPIKYPRIVEFVKELPKTPLVEKVWRRKLRGG